MVILFSSSLILYPEVRDMLADVKVLSAARGRLSLTPPQTRTHPIPNQLSDGQRGSPLIFTPSNATHALSAWILDSN